MNLEQENRLQKCHRDSFGIAEQEQTSEMSKRLNKRLSLFLIRDLSLSLKSALTNETVNKQIIDEFIQTICISHVIMWNDWYRNWLARSEARLVSSKYECRVVKNMQNLFNFNLFNSSEIVLRRISITKIRAIDFEQSRLEFSQSLYYFQSDESQLRLTVISYWLIRVNNRSTVERLQRQSWIETTDDSDQNLSATAYFSITNFDSLDSFSITRSVKKRQINWLRKTNSKVENVSHWTLLQLVHDRVKLKSFSHSILDEIQSSVFQSSIKKWLALQ